MSNKPSPKITREKLPAIYELGDRAIILRKLDEAAWCFERAMELEPNAPRPYMGLAQVRQLQGQGRARPRAGDGRAAPRG